LWKINVGTPLSGARQNNAYQWGLQNAFYQLRQKQRPREFDLVPIIVRFFLCDTRWDVGNLYGLNSMRVLGSAMDAKRPDR